LNYTRNRVKAYQPGLRCQSAFFSLCVREFFAAQGRPPH